MGHYNAITQRYYRGSPVATVTLLIVAVGSATLATNRWVSRALGSLTTGEETTAARAPGFVPVFTLVPAVLLFPPVEPPPALYTAM